MKIQSSFSGFSVNSLSDAKKFYCETLGLKAEDKIGGTLLSIPAGASVWIYQKENHKPAEYTVLNFIVEDIEEAYQDLASKAVEFELYEGSPQDEKGIMWGKKINRGPNIAWFKDPAGNILAILEN